MSFIFKSVIPGAAAMLAIATIATAVAPAPADAGYWRRDNQRSAIWMYVNKRAGEDVWQACRRVYHRDVYQVRNAGPNRARCYVDTSQMNNPGGYYRSNERN